MSWFSSGCALTFPVNHSKSDISFQNQCWSLYLPLHLILLCSCHQGLYSQVRTFLKRLKKPEVGEVSGAAGVWGWCRAHPAGVTNLAAQLCSGFLGTFLLCLGTVPRLENRSMASIFQISISFVNYRWRPTLFHKWIMGWVISSRPETEKLKDALRSDSCK